MTLSSGVCVTGNVSGCRVGKYTLSGTAALSHYDKLSADKFKPYKESDTLKLESQKNA